MKPSEAKANAGAGLGFAVVAAGLAFDPSAYAADPKRVLGMCIAIVASLLAVGDALRSRKAPQRASGAVVAALAFVALSASSLAWGAAPGRLDVATWAAGAGAGWLAMRMPQPRAVAVARWAACGLGAGSAAIALGSAVLGHRGFALHGGQGNPNWLGLLLAVTLPLSVDAACAALGRPSARPAVARTAFALLAVTLEVPALYLSHSRVAWVAAAFACILQLWFEVAARAASVRAASRASAVVLCAVMAAIAVLRSSSAAATTSTSAGEDAPASQSLEGRVWIGTMTARAALAEAPWGAGLGRFGHAYHEAQGRALAPLSPRAAARRYSNATTAHDEYLQAACESGPLAALALLAMFAFAVRAHVRARWPAGAASMLACAVAALGDSPLRQPAIVLVVGLVLGATRPRAHRRKLSAPRHTRLALGSLAVAASFSWLLDAATRSWLATRMRTTAMELTPRARLERLERSAALDPASGEAWLDLGLAELVRGEAGPALAHLERARARVADVAVLAGIGDARRMLGDADGALDAYRAALAWEPGSLRVRIGLSEALLARRDYDAAEEAARVADKLAPSDARVRELIDSIHEARMAHDTAD